MRSAWLAAGLGCLVLQAGLRPLISQQQRQAELVMAAEGETGLAADTALPVLALGAFRGLVVDYLWLRSIALREQGRHFESRQIAEQIGRLQPRMWEVWEFLGHDLAYNTSRLFTDWETRWRWIQNGTELLRDEGLRHNPDTPQLYFMLARIYQDKIGGPFDDFHLQFKYEHAKDLLLTLGDATPQELAAAPPLGEVLRDPEVAALVEEAAALNLPPLTDYVLPAEQARRYSPDLSAWKTGPPLEVREWTVEVMQGPAWQKLVLPLRVYWAQEWYRLEPEGMVRVDERFGPLDWRGVDAMALYWIDQGIEVAREQGDVRYEYRLQQIALSALRSAVRRGKLTVDPSGAPYLVPNLGLIPRIDALYRENVRLTDEKGAELVEALTDPRRREELSEDELQLVNSLSGFQRNQRSAREDFLGEAIELLTSYGRDADARELFRVARRDYPEQANFQVPFEEFVIWATTLKYADPGTYDTQVGTSQRIEGTWTQAYRMLATGQDERYRVLAQRAGNIQRRWQRYIQSQLAIDPGAARRLGVPFDTIRRRALWNASRGLPIALQERLAERVPGLTLAELRSPPPQISLPPPRAGDRP